MDHGLENEGGVLVKRSMKVTGCQRQDHGEAEEGASAKHDAVTEKGAG